MEEIDAEQIILDILMAAETKESLFVNPQFFDNLVNQAQLCSEMLFMIDNIKSFREAEKKVKRIPDRIVYAVDLKKMIMRINSTYKKRAEHGKIIIYGIEDPFYYPVILKHSSVNYFRYFNDVDAAELLKDILSPSCSEDKKMVPFYILTLKKAFHTTKKGIQEGKINIFPSKVLCVLISKFYSLFPGIIIQYQDVIEADKRGDRGRSKSGKTKLSLDILNEHLKHGMPIFKMKEELTKLGIKQTFDTPLYRNVLNILIICI